MAMIPATELLFRADARLAECDATVLEAGAQGIVLDRTVFYARAGGQPGDTGSLRWEGSEASVTDTLKGEGDTTLHVLVEGSALPAPGTRLVAAVNWPRRHRIMRMHTTLHLLCSLLPGAGVTGGQIGADRSRLDFDLPDPPSRETLTERLAALVAADHPLADRWITEAELDAAPALVRTLSVQPPRGSGRIRLVQIGAADAPVDLQPCGGTHVASTGEIGRVDVIKIENKGRQNRRITVALVEE